jgi:hypothetical protein
LRPLRNWQAVGRPFSWKNRGRLLEDVFSEGISDGDKLALVRFIIENIFPNLPCVEDFSVFSGFLFDNQPLSLPPFPVSIFSVSTPRELTFSECYFCLSACISPNLPHIRNYLLDLPGCRFHRRHLGIAAATFNHDLYKEIAAHLPTDAATDHLRRYPVLSDFCAVLLIATKTASYRDTFADVIDFLRQNPILLNHIVPLYKSLAGLDQIGNEVFNNPGEKSFFWGGFIHFFRLTGENERFIVGGENGVCCGRGGNGDGGGSVFDAYGAQQRIGRFPYGDQQRFWRFHREYQIWLES